jgi:hypothetical protein
MSAGILRTQRMKMIAKKLAFHSNRGYQELSSMFVFPSKDFFGGIEEHQMRTWILGRRIETNRGRHH